VIALQTAADFPVRVLAVADTDSYLKWSAATLDALPNCWESAQLLIENPVMPSTAQIRAASSRMVEVLSHAGVKRRIRRERPDVVLMACTGPVVAALTDQRTLWSGHRPLLVTGLPGISVPATRRAVTARAACDLFLLHSKREIADFCGHGSAVRAATRIRIGAAALSAPLYADDRGRFATRAQSDLRSAGEGACGASSAGTDRARLG
jgi:hypothetical protein